MLLCNDRLERTRADAELQVHLLDLLRGPDQGPQWLFSLCYLARSGVHDSETKGASAVQGNTARLTLCWKLFQGQQPPFFLGFYLVSVVHPSVHFAVLCRLTAFCSSFDSCCAAKWPAPTSPHAPAK